MRIEVHRKGRSFRASNFAAKARSASPHAAAALYLFHRHGFPVSAGVAAVHNALGSESVDPKMQERQRYLARSLSGAEARLIRRVVILADRAKASQA